MVRADVAARHEARRAFRSARRSGSPAPTDDAGTIVTAGTGSGKTIAFYLPAMIRIGEAIGADPLGQGDRDLSRGSSCSRTSSPKPIAWRDRSMQPLAANGKRASTDRRTVPRDADARQSRGTRRARMGAARSPTSSAPGCAARFAMANCFGARPTIEAERERLHCARPWLRRCRLRGPYRADAEAAAAAAARHPLHDDRDPQPAAI